MNITARSTFRAGDFARLEAKLAPLMIKAVSGVADDIFQRSQQLVPVESGELQQSGASETEWKGTVITGSVVYNAHHAAFVEYGTGLRGSGTYPYELPTQGVPITGGWVYDYKKQNWQGMVAQPYLRPALEEVRPNILKSMALAMKII